MKTKKDTPLTCYGLVFTVVFGILTFLVFSQALNLADERLFFTINQSTLGPPLSDLLVFLSIYGREGFWIGVLIGLWILGGKRKRTTTVMLILIFGMLVIIGAGLKSLLYRPRPYETLTGVRLLLSPLEDSSYPSGHALFVSAGAATAWLRLRKAYAIPLVIEAFLVAYSRIYGGVHYPMDVLAGSFLGIGVTCLVLAHQTKLEPFFRSLNIAN